MGALWWGTTWAYWFFSTDVSYIVPAAMLVGATLAVTANLTSIRSAAAAGILAALAILTWEANVFLIPALLLRFILARRESRGLQPLAAIGFFLGSCLFLVGLAYLSIGVLVYHYRAPSELMRWAGSHGTASLPMWGHWNLERIQPLWTTVVESLLPLRTRLEAGEFIGSVVTLPGTTYRLSVLASLALAVFLIIRAVSGRAQGFKGSKSILWLLTGYAIYLPFIFWWDPFEAKWMVIPNLFLGALIAVLASGVETWRTRAVVFGCILLIAIANFSTTMWPRHAKPLFALSLANCVARNMGEEDLFVATDWGWVEYLAYLHHRRVVSLIDVSAQLRDKETTLQEVRRHAIEAQARHGNVYMLDFTSYRPEHLGWLQTQTGVTIEDLNRLQNHPAFACGETKFKALTPLASDGSSVRSTGSHSGRGQ